MTEAEPWEDEVCAEIHDSYTRRHDFEDLHDDSGDAVCRICGQFEQSRFIEEHCPGDPRPGKRRTSGDIVLMPWRTGRKVPKNIYAVVGDSPSDDDIDIGRMDSEEIAVIAVLQHNNALKELGK